MSLTLLERKHREIRRNEKRVHRSWKFLSELAMPAGPGPGKADHTNNWAAYLECYRWDYFCTITFKQPRKDSIYNARQIWEFLFEHNLASRAFLISEPHTTGFLHYHSLLRAQKDFLGDGIANAWDVRSACQRVFGHTDVSDIRSMAETTRYISKYISKAIDSPSVDYFLYGDWKTNSPLP